MKNNILTLILAVFLFIACANENKKEDPNSESSNKIEVIEHINGGGYTFIKGKNNGKEIWIAVREMNVKVGDEYYFFDAMEMKNFKSKSLNKTFESILFVNTISDKNETTSNKSQNTTPDMINSHSGDANSKDVEDSPIKVEPLKDGISVADVNKKRIALAGKIVKIKGVVTKYNGDILNRNWIHIQDGSEYKQFFDVTVTSDQPAKVGETIIIEGTVTVDKDFGGGYFYDVIIENAKIKKVEDI